MALTSAFDFSVWVELLTAIALGAGAGATAAFVALLSNQRTGILAMTVLALVAMVGTGPFGVDLSPIAAVAVLTSALFVFVSLGHTAET